MAEGGVLGTAGAAGSWDLEEEDASSPISEPLLSESPLHKVLATAGVWALLKSVSYWESPKNRVGDEGSETPGDFLLEQDLGGGLVLVLRFRGGIQ